MFQSCYTSVYSSSVFLSSLASSIGPTSLFCVSPHFYSCFLFSSWVLPFIEPIKLSVLAMHFVSLAASKAWNSFPVTYMTSYVFLHSPPPNSFPLIIFFRFYYHSFYFVLVYSMFSSLRPRSPLLSFRGFLDATPWAGKCAVFSHVPCPVCLASLYM